jgi:hypothetical protein
MMKGRSIWVGEKRSAGSGAPERCTIIIFEAFSLMKREGWGGIYLARGLVDKEYFF